MTTPDAYSKFETYFHVQWCYVFILCVKLYDNKELNISRNSEAKYWPYRPWFFIMGWTSNFPEITEISSAH